MADDNLYPPSSEGAERRTPGLGRRWITVRSRLGTILARIEDAPNGFWIALGFLVAYLAFFVVPIFLTAARMRQPEVVPILSVKGPDLRQTLTFVKAWLDGGTPFVESATYPPFSYVILRPLLFVHNPDRYAVVTWATLVAYGLITLVFPLKVGRTRTISPVLLLIFATGLISYGLQFELERGQFDVIAVLLAYSAIWIYHSERGPKILAFVLLTIAAQLKLYPFIFIVMLVRDWRDWKSNARSFLLFAAANFALLFALGPRVFVDFVNAIRAAPSLAGIVWNGNHSIHSFVYLAAQHAAARGSMWLEAHAGYLEYALLAVVGLSLLLIMVQAYRQNLRGVNPGLLVACAVAAMLIPAVSHDYKLSILGGPIALYFAGLEPAASRGARRLLLIPAILAISFAYAATLFPFTYKPLSLVFQSDTPALFLILLVVTGISLWAGRVAREPHRAPVDAVSPAP